MSIFSANVDIDEIKEYAVSIFGTISDNDRNSFTVINNDGSRKVTIIVKQIDKKSCYVYVDDSYNKMKIGNAIISGTQKIKSYLDNCKLNMRF